MKAVQLISTLMFTTLMSCSAMAADFSERASEWLGEALSVPGSLAVTLSKQKIMFKGCKQKEYQLAFSKTIAKNLDLEAIAHYEYGMVDFGVLNQKISTRSYELVSWWNRDDYRIGLSHKMQTEHELASPMTEHINLPMSQSVGLYVEMAGLNDDHIMVLSAVHESWENDDTMPWHQTQDNQIGLRYSMAF